MAVSSWHSGNAPRKWGGWGKTPVRIGTEMKISSRKSAPKEKKKERKKRKSILLPGARRVRGSHLRTPNRTCPETETTHDSAVSHPRRQEKECGSDVLCVHVCAGSPNFLLSITGQKGASVHSGEGQSSSKRSLSARASHAQELKG